MKKNFNQTVSLLIIFFSITINDLIAQNIRGDQTPPRYIYDESHLLTKYKNALKQHPFMADSIREIVNDKIDSLEKIEDKKITHVLNRINKSSHFEFDQSYTDKSVSSGRLTGIDGYTYSPSFAYKSNFGFYTRITIFEYPQDAAIKPKLPEWDLTFGYKKRFGDNLYLYSNFTHSFILYGNLETRALLTDRLSVSAYYDLDFIFIGASYGFSWGGTNKTPDVEKRSSQLNLMIDKEFTFNHFMGSYYFSIDPQFSLCYGSDNFVQLRKRALLQETKKKVAAKDTAVQNTFFGLLAIDAAVEFTYTIKNFDFYYSPHLVIPYNELGDKNKRDPSAGTPIFYNMLGITYRFRVSKN